MSSKSEAVSQVIVIESAHFRILDENNELTKESVMRFLKPPYPVTYLINTGLIVLGITFVLLIYYGLIPTHTQGFFCKDPLFSHKYTGNTITAEILAIGEIFLILLVLFIESYARTKSLRAIFTVPSMVESYYYLKYITLGMILVQGSIEIAKSIAGEHRPDFFDVCRPDTNMNCTAGEYIRSFTCTNTERFAVVDLVDVSRSFPSGHSSLSWFTAIYCAYIFHTRLPSETTGSMFKLSMIGLCVMWGMLCSISRITDRRHHWWDVLFGTIIGFIGAGYMIRNTQKKIRQIRTVEYEQKFNRRRESKGEVEVFDLEGLNLV